MHKINANNIKRIEYNGQYNLYTIQWIEFNAKNILQIKKNYIKFAKTWERENLIYA